MAKGERSAGADAAMQAALEATRNYGKEVQGTGGGMAFIIPRGVDFFKMKEERIVRLNFLPYRITVDNHKLKIPKGGLYWTRTVLVHPGFGPNNEQIICPRTVGKKCPSCEYAIEVAKQPNHDKREVTDNKAKLRGLYNVAFADDSPETPMFWCVSTYKFGERLAAELDYATEEQIGFWRPDGGITLKLRFREERLGNSKPFLAVNRIDFEKRETDYDESIADKTIDLDSCLNILPYDELYKKFYNMDDADKGGEEGGSAEEEKITRNAHKPEADTKAEESESAGAGEGGEENPEGGPEQVEPGENEGGEPAKEPKEKKEGSGGTEGKRRRRSRKKKEEENPCPREHTFGEDNDEFEDCEKCEKWEECANKYDELHPPEDD